MPELIADLPAIAILLPAASVYFLWALFHWIFNTGDEQAASDTQTTDPQQPHSQSTPDTNDTTLAASSQPRSAYRDKSSRGAALQFSASENKAALDSKHTKADEYGDHPAFSTLFPKLGASHSEDQSIGTSTVISTSGNTDKNDSPEVTTRLKRPATGTAKKEQTKTSSGRAVLLSVEKSLSERTADAKTASHTSDDSSSNTAHNTAGKPKELNTGEAKAAGTSTDHSAHNERRKSDEAAVEHSTDTPVDHTAAGQQAETTASPVHINPGLKKTEATSDAPHNRQTSAARSQSTTYRTAARRKLSPVDEVQLQLKADNQSALNQTTAQTNRTLALQDAHDRELSKKDDQIAQLKAQLESLREQPRELPGDIDNVNYKSRLENTLAALEDSTRKVNRLQSAVDKLQAAGAANQGIKTPLKNAGNRPSLLSKVRVVGST